MFDKKLTFYPTYGYRPGGVGEWRIPVRAGVRNERPMPPDALIRLCFDEEGDLDERGLLRFEECLRDFWADDNEGEEVAVKFDHDGQTYKLPGESDANGLVEGELRLDADGAERVAAAQLAAGSVSPGTLALTAHTRGWSGEGAERIRDMFRIDAHGVCLQEQGEGARARAGSRGRRGGPPASPARLSGRQKREFRVT